MSARPHSCVLALLLGCSGTAGGAADGSTVGDAAVGDAGMNVYDDGGMGPPDGCADRCSSAVAPGCGPTDACDDGLDGDCDGTVDETCPCVPGTVQPCFVGPPGSRNVGACSDGTQRCVGSFEFGTWGGCEGGVSPGSEACDDLDNDCNGCADDALCCDAAISCPGPGDPRVPDAQPFTDYVLDGAAFYTGTPLAWSWTVEGGPCEPVLRTPSYELEGEDTATPTFRARLSGDYRVTVEVMTADGETLTCTFVIHVEGPGVRIELCWANPDNMHDLDIYVHDPRNTDPWFSGDVSPLNSTTDASCHWGNCAGMLRGGHPRANWGYPDSPLGVCQDGPRGGDFSRIVGACPNPRLDLDDRLARGYPENVNIDNPRDGETFRVMVTNWEGIHVEPILNVYCGGRRSATFGAAPDVIPDYSGPSFWSGLGPMWRAADITVSVNAAGETTGCAVTPLHPPGETTGYDIRTSDPSY